MANHRSSYRLPCSLRLTERYEGMTCHGGQFVLDNGNVVVAKSFDPVNNCYLCSRCGWITTIEDRFLEPVKG